MYFFFQNQCIFKLRDRKIWAYFSPFGIIHAVLSRIYSLFGGGVPKFTNINYAYKEWQVRPAFSLFKLLYDQAVHKGRPTIKKFFLEEGESPKMGVWGIRVLKFFPIVLRIRFLALKGKNSLSDPKFSSLSNLSDHVWHRCGWVRSKLSCHVKPVDQQQISI